MATHEQVFVKVNAPVDRGVAVLITALSAFPKLRTFESCENLNGWAWACFSYGEFWDQPCRELAPFVLEFLGPRLACEFGDHVRLSLVSDGGIVRAEMAVEPDAISAVASFLEQLAFTSSRPQ